MVSKKITLAECKEMLKKCKEIFLDATGVYDHGSCGHCLVGSENCRGYEEKECRETRAKWLDEQLKSSKPWCPPWESNRYVVDNKLDGDNGIITIGTDEPIS